MKKKVFSAALTIVAIMVISLGATPLSAKSSELAATDDTGVPEGFAPETWTRASGTAEVVEQRGSEDTIRLTAEGLVPDSIYTIWWVTPRIIGMDMGPGGGVPQNAFTADHEGRAEARITVPSDNTYRMMVVAYHADHKLHGDEPGEMGDVTFEHIKGDWPRRDAEFSGR